MVSQLLEIGLKSSDLARPVLLLLSLGFFNLENEDVLGVLELFVSVDDGLIVSHKLADFSQLLDFSFLNDFIVSIANNGNEQLQKHNGHDQSLGKEEDIPKNPLLCRVEKRGVEVAQALGVGVNKGVEKVVIDRVHAWI